MSFQDLERGLGERADLARDLGISPDDDRQFKALARAVSLQILKINANVSAIYKLIDLLGGPKDNTDLRTKLHNLTDVTREVLKDSDVKKLVTMNLLPEDQHHRQEQQKVSNDFKKALVSFQAASKRSVERQRTFNDRAKATLDTAGPTRYEDDTDEGGQLLELSDQRQTQVLVDAIPDSEIEFREQLIQEREGEIEEIEQGITELNQIFKDLAVMVGEQGTLIDNIYSNVSNVAADTGSAAVELRSAEAYQRKAGRRMFCLFLVFLVVLSVVLLAILS